jgi:hypothetical protein
MATSRKRSKVVDEIEETNEDTSILSSSKKQRLEMTVEEVIILNLSMKMLYYVGLLRFLL